MVAPATSPPVTRPERYDNPLLRDLASPPPLGVHRGMGIDEFVAAILVVWRDADPRTDQTVTRMGETTVRFARRLRALDVTTVDRIDPEACRGFIDAPTRTGDQPANTTRHFRRVTLRALFRTGRTLGALDSDPTIDLALPPRTSLKARPLTDDEIMLCRTAAFPTLATDLRRPAAWALAEATAATSEIPLIRRSDLRPDGVPETVALPGTRRLRARVVELTDWATTILTRRLAEIDDDPATPVAYVGHAAAGTVARHASACGLVGAVLAASGLASEADVRPASVRHWRGRRELGAGARVESIALLLGHASLDETAQAVAHDWCRQ